MAQLLLNLPSVNFQQAKLAQDGALDRPIVASRWLSVRRRMSVVGTLVITLAFAATWSWSQISTKVTLGIAGAPSVETESLRIGLVEQGPLSHEISVESRAVAAFRPTLYSPAVGIAILHVVEGQAVEKGTRLAMIESPELNNRLAQEQAQLAALESNYSRRQLLAKQARVDHNKAKALVKLQQHSIQRELARSEALAAEGLIRKDELETLQDRLAIANLEAEHLQHQGAMQAAISDFEADDAKRQVQRQQLVVADLQRRVAELSIHAPFTGQVASLSIQTRDAVVQGQALLRLVDLHKLELEVRIPEAYAAEISVGTTARIATGDEEHPGRLSRVAPEVLNGEVLGRVAFDPGHAPALRQNQRVITRLMIGRSNNALHIPRGPYLQGGGRNLYVHSPGSLELRSVQLGFVGVARVEVLSGLHPGEQVVLNDLSRHEGAPIIRLR